MTLSPGAKIQPKRSTLRSPAGFSAACSSMLSDRAPTPPRFIGHSTWMSRMGSKPNRWGMRFFTSSMVRGTAGFEAAALGIDLERAVDGFGILRCCPVQALGRAPGRSAEQKLHGLRCENTQDRVDDGGLADARSAGDHEDLGSECKTDSRFLAWRQFEADPILYPWQCPIAVDRVPGKL